MDARNKEFRRVSKEERQCIFLNNSKCKREGFFMYIILVWDVTFVLCELKREIILSDPAL